VDRAVAARCLQSRNAARSRHGWRRSPAQRCCSIAAADAERSQGHVEASSALDRIVSPLDAARRAAFLTARRLPILGAIVARRDLRVMAQTSLGISSAAALTFLAPGVLFALGPIALGVPHVAADVRFLLLRRDVPRALVVVVSLVCAALALSRLSETMAPSVLPFGRIEVTLGFGLPIVCAALGARIAGSPWRALAIIPLLVWVLVESFASPNSGRLVFAYAHNVIAIALWAILYRRRRLFALPALAIALFVTWLFVSGAALPNVSFSSPWAHRLVDETMAVAPSWMPQRTALGLGLSYVFLQSVHYAVWLAWVPQEDLRAEGTTTFRMSLRSLTRDFGKLGFALVVATSLGVVLSAFLDLHRTRFLYLSIATFHGYLELGALAFFVALGRMPRDEVGGRAR
jgi:hypothetical protein